MRKRLVALFLSIITAAVSGCSPAPVESQAPTARDERPNILLIVADDLGYADLGGERQHHSNAGYNTYTVGKWHLGLTPETSPHAAGFSRSFNLLDGAGTHFDDIGFFEGGSTYWADDDFSEYPVGRYSTEVYMDRLIEFIDANKME